MNIYVGNLNYKLREEELREVFEAHGEVESARIITDRETGRSKGFGFVQMPDGSEGQAAIDALNGVDMGGRPLKVNESQPRPQSGPRY